MSIRTIANIEELDYDKLREMIGEDSDLPHTYTEWETKREEDIKKYSKKGDVIKYASISSAGFQEYLRVSGLTASQVTFGAYQVYASQNQ